MTAIVFHPFRLLTLEQELWHGDELVPLRPKAFAILKCLLEQPGQLVTREELLARFWGDVHLSEGVLKTQISEIRQALGDCAREPRFIETRHRLGYRFIGALDPALLDDRAESPEIPRSASTRPDRPRCAEHFVGRDAEFEALTEHWRATLAGERRVVFVTGEAGVGKSALVNEFLERLLVAPEAPVVTWGQCIDQYGAGEAYLPIIEAMRRWCARPDGDRMVDALKRNAPTWLPVMPSLHARAGTPAVDAGAAPAVPGRMLREMAEALESFTRTNALVLLIEDLEWADHSTLDLLAYLAQRSAPARLMVIGTYRPRDALAGRLSDVSDTLRARNHCVELCVPRLGEADVGAYLARRFADHRLPAGVHELLHRRTEGNALFMVGVIEGWLDRGLLEVVDGRCELRASLSELARLVPHSIVRMIEKELDRFDAFERGVLEAASVAGTEFSTASVAAALDADLLRVEETCMRWARRGQFLRNKGQAEWNDGTVAERYEFLYVLYQQVTYDQLGAVRQAHFHLRIGERLEAGHAAAAAVIAAELALHFERGRDYARAVRYLTSAGERALQRSAYRETLDHVTLALELAARLPATDQRSRAELDLQLMLAVALRITKGYAAPEVEAAYARAAELCAVSEVTDSQRALLLAGRGAVELVRGKSTNALALGGELLESSEQGGNATSLAAGHLLTGIAHCRLGRLRAAEAHLESVFAFPRTRAQSLCETLVAQEFGSVARCYLAYSLCLRGHFERAKSTAQLALEEAESLGNPFAHAHALCFRSVVHRLCGDWDGAYAMAESLAALSAERGFAMFSACAIHIQGAIWRLRGNWELALDMLGRGLASFRATGSAAYVSQYVGLLAECYAELGESELALGILDEGLAEVDSDVERLWNAELYRIKGDVLWHASPGRRPADLCPSDPLERNAEAERCWLRALDIARAQEAKLLELRAATSLARYWRDRGKPADGRALLAEICGRFAGGARTPDLEQAFALLAQISEASSAA